MHIQQKDVSCGKLQTVMYFSLEVSGKSSLHLVTLCHTLRIQMYTNAQLWKDVVKKCQESLIVIFHLWCESEHTQLHDVLRLLDPGHAFTNNCQNVQNDEQQHHLKIPTFFGSQFIAA